MKNTTTNMPESHHRQLKTIVDQYEFLTMSNLIAYAVEVMLEGISTDELEELNEKHKEKKRKDKIAFMGRYNGNG